MQGLAALAHPQSLSYLSDRGLMSFIPETHPVGSINAVQMGS
ncbi:hypothetical protein YPPY66_3634 [Yersinia pestis PY-66]|uniref:Uncharacterized protein n=1 Tax=Yersinia pestis PY-08 TaxID=992134 RepID=A0AB72ZFU5_YERPE|nr:hypothetical protein YPD27_3424 [Yersinia pestis KIM D27]EIQ99761.1 hypothetical protein YPPY04_3338 [Yersinia pestis PY-04]EIR04235.1 hypothetical protein YPPY06_3374 [Yersinia pestis PY-06]EIR15861.1 hypothetical protein YPPY08_3367 [Yersinia pestis PY-08]EIR17855.1 hypothetical protein YPPY09_3382 [Yersinia pestis PY-09]EIR31040.1 hypothetical protein YPPY11_3463 [Yersinia pestis PY-11]EIR31472.1 hypothetical protein YPPY12_3505 [Yersinia pestis PY-12]EIR58319.1 hypothetical protein YP